LGTHVGRRHSMSGCEVLELYLLLSTPRDATSVGVGIFAGSLCSSYEKRALKVEYIGFCLSIQQGPHTVHEKSLR